MLTETLLLTATTAGTYRCELRAYFNGPAAHHMTAIRGNSFGDTGTWLQVSAANEAGSHEWRPPFCDTHGTDDLPPPASTLATQATLVVRSWLIKWSNGLLRPMPPTLTSPVNSSSPPATTVRALARPRTGVTMVYSARRRTR